MATREQQLAAIMTAESGGKNQYNYLYATNPSYYTASGYYQFTNTTWKQGASWAGVDTSQYPTAISAPYEVQTQVANAVIDHVGMQPWSGSRANSLISQIDSGGNPTLITAPVDGGGGVSSGTTTLASNTPDTSGQGYGSNGYTVYPVIGPDGNPTGAYVSGTPGDPATNYLHSGETLGQPLTSSPSGTTGGSGSGTSTTPSTSNPAISGIGAGQPGYLPPASTGGPMAVGITPGLATGIGGWIGNIETAVGNWMTTAFKALFGSLADWFARFWLMVLGVLLILVALWRVMDPSGEKTKAVVSHVAEAAA